jgi:hypothetical protein
MAELSDARDAVDTQIGEVRKASGTNELAKAPAILAALSNRELSETLLTHADELGALVENMTGKMEHNARMLTDQLGQATINLAMLTTQIRTFMVAADEGTKNLTKWTKWLAIATGGLVVAALVVGIVQALVTLFAAPPILVVPTR